MAPTYVDRASASATSTSVAVSAPPGLAAEDHQLMVVGVSSGSETVTTPSDWLLLRSVLNDADPGPYQTYTFVSSIATGSVTITKSGSAAVHAVRLAWRGGGGWVTSTVNSTEGTTSTNSHAMAAVTTTTSDALVVGVIHCDSGSAATTFTMPGPWVERADLTVLTGRSIGVYDVERATTGTQTGTVTSSRSDFSNVIAVELSGAAAPTVSSGADASHPVNSVFSRTATDDGNGLTITAREWKIQAGPTGVGNVLATAAALTWAPTVAGTYTLRYSATSSAGTSTDDVTVIVLPEYIRGVSVATGNGDGAAALQISVPKPAGVIDGDNMVMICGNDFLAATSTGWVRDAAVGQSAYDAAFNIFQKVATASEPSSYTVNASTSTTAIVALVAFKGDHVGVEWDVVPALETVTSTATTTSPVAPTISPTSGRPVLLTAYVSREASTGFAGHTPPTGMLELADSWFTTPGRALLVTTELVTPGATGTRTATVLGSAADYVGISMALTPAIPPGSFLPLFG